MKYLVLLVLQGKALLLIEPQFPSFVRRAVIANWVAMG